MLLLYNIGQNVVLEFDQSQRLCQQTEAPEIVEFLQLTQLIHQMLHQQT